MQSKVSNSSGNDSPRTIAKRSKMGKKSKSDRKEGGILMAMMPGAKIDKKGKMILNVATSKDTVVFNVGGKKFETYCSTLHAQPKSKLADEKFLNSHFRKQQGDYFFDKDPDIFRVVLNYLRTGELHLPSYICGPAVKDELEYWGLSYQLIERCCWTNYNSWNSTLEALNQLESDRKGTLDEDLLQTGTNHTSRWKCNRPKLWAFLNDPKFSKGSKDRRRKTGFLLQLACSDFGELAAKSWKSVLHGRKETSSY